MGFALSGKKSQRLKVVACIPLDQEAVGFAVPVLIHSTDPRSLAVQEVDELSGRVCGFRILEQQKSQMINVTADSSVGIGEEQLYAFFSAPDSVDVGTLATLRGTLEQFAAANPSREGVILQIKELIGSDSERKLARAQMRRFLLSVQGAEAARSFYEGSVLRSVLWSRLLSAATTKEMCKRILQARGRLSASIDQDGKILLDLAALNTEDRASIDAAKLISAILLEFDPQPATADKSANLAEDEVHDAVRIQRRVEDLLGLIEKTGRQEERIALLMAAVLGNPTVGKSALLQYQTDRAKTAAWAIAELRKAFIDTNWSSDERVIAALVPQLFTKQWPMTRGDLLFFLAKHLAMWPQVNAAIRAVLQRTHSMYVDWSRNEIEDALGVPQTAPSKHQGIARGRHDPLPNA